MKTNKFLTLVLTIVASLAIVSCVQDDDYTIPTSLGDEENARLNTLLANGTEISIAEAKAMYSVGDFLEPIDENIYIKGYVSSSDKSGNFFKEFYLQDSPSSPTTAIKVIINQVDLYNQFNFGREVYVSLKDLYIGEERVGNGVTAIGGGIETDQYGTTVTSLGQTRARTHVFRSPVTEEIVPLSVSVSQINSSLVGVFIQLDNVEFADNLAGKRYFDPMEDFDTKRQLQSCGGVNYTTINLETSGFSTFKNELLPTGNGTLKAVVNKTFDGASVVLALNSVDDVNLEGNRCSLAVAIFSEDFESATNNTNLDIPGWTNFAEAGSWVWREKIFDNNGYTEFSTFNSGSPVNIAWLVSPGIDMDAQEDERLNFTAAQHHLESEANTLEVFVSTDFDGTDVLAATWEPVSASLPTMDNSWYEMVDSGLIDISGYTGTLYVAFKVTGSGTDTSLDGAYQVDNFNVFATE
ncbi:protein of unknown function [Bizionia echini]|uniref:DUF5689 domain-containing protein n=1 Tax=Bizionia echini TaxID=649333 RepID=A0A1I4Z2K7_9FLAO|nr:DUF5689 domain-containing protein [Bizionia echini]SFN44130.1 protein of unknown function [Bizionia echini]